jgi:hypothetical protein
MSPDLILLDVFAGAGSREAQLVADDRREQVAAAVVGNEVDLGGVDAHGTLRAALAGGGPGRRPTSRRRR